MTSRTCVLVAGVVAIMVQAGGLRGASYYVATNSLSNGPGTNWVTAFRSVDGGISAAGDQDTVWVSNGVYVLSAPLLVTNGITLCGVGGPAATILNGNRQTGCLRVEHPQAVVERFAIVHGSNTTDYVGGGVYVSAGVVRDCEISDNWAGQGGGVYLYQGGSVSNCTIARNLSEDKGAGVFFEAGGIVRDSLIVSNATLSRGGGACFQAGGLLEGCTVMANTGAGWGSSALRFNNGGVASNCAIVQNVAIDGGGVIRFSGGGAVYDCTISSNSGPGLSVFYDNAGAGTAVNCRITGNISTDGPGGCSYMKDCYIAQNQATNGDGGGMSLDGGWLAVGCTIVDNFAAERGGGVQLSSDMLVGCTIVSNKAGLEGGGVSGWGGNVLTGCVIRANVAMNGRGGGMAAGPGDEMWDCEFSGNGASTGGGGVDGGYGTVVTHCLIHSNTASWGGGVNTWGGTNRVYGCVIEGNAATNGVGGGVAAGQGDEVRDCSVSGNSAANSAGGIWFNLGGIASNCWIRGNTAYDGGGGRCFSNGIFTACSIVSNSSISGAGGVSLSFGGVLSHCVIQGNSGVGGGGVDLSGGGAMTNCLVVGNTASWGGGVKFNAGGVMENCTIASNTATIQGGGVNCDFGGFIQNTIIQHNSGPAYSQNYYSDGAAVFAYCSTTPDPGGIGHQGDDPRFVDSAGGDFRLATNSYCIDAGTNEAWMSVATDLEGRPRIIHGRADIGAYEAILPDWDADSDGIPDWWTWQYFGHLTGMVADLSRAVDSADGTGVDNLYKYVADLDPTNAASAFRIVAFSNLPPNRIACVFSGSSNRVYSLQWSSNLVAGSWWDVAGQTNVVGAGALMTLGDSNAAACRFYRVGVNLP